MGSQQSAIKGKRQRKRFRQQRAPSDEELEEKRLLNSGCPIIVVFGQSGTGKSTFINLIANEQQEVGESIDSCTDKVTFVEAKIKGKSVVIVDTPGTDDTRPGVTDADVLETIAHRLEVTGRQKRWVTGVLYLHRITETRFTPTASRTSIVLRKLCGDNALNRVVFCTTMWDMPSSEECTRRHGQLCNTQVLGGMISKGLNTATHSNHWDNAQANAEDILSKLIGAHSPGPLAIQNEIIKQDKTVAETSAGQVVMEHLGEEKAKMRVEIKELRQQISDERGDTAARLAEVLATSQEMMSELKRQEKQLSKPDRGESCIIC